MGRIGVVELFVVAMIGGGLLLGLLAAIVLGVRAAASPKSCPHCGKPLR